jgi:hypothetical protein
MMWRAENYGFLWKEVLRTLGVTRPQIRTYLRRGERVVTRGVFVVCAVPPTWGQELMALSWRLTAGRCTPAGEALRGISGDGTA